MLLEILNFMTWKSGQKRKFSCCRISKANMANKNQNNVESSFSCRQLIILAKFPIHDQINDCKEIKLVIYLNLVVSLRPQFENLQGDSESQELARAQFISLWETTPLVDFHVRTSEMVFPASLALPPPRLANHPYCFWWYECLPMFEKLASCVLMLVEK